MNANPPQLFMLALLSALVAVFGGLWLQWPSHAKSGRRIGQAPPLGHRHLMWMAGWCFAVGWVALRRSAGGKSGLGLALSFSAMELTPLMFMSSLAPPFLTRKPKMFYAAALGAPILLYAWIAALDTAPGFAARMALLACTAAALIVAGSWSLQKNLLPVWLSLAISGAFGACWLWLTAEGRYADALGLVHGGMLLIAALLFAKGFARLTVGVAFTVGGLALWGLPEVLSLAARASRLSAEVLRGMDVVMVLTAVGMIVLVLEDEIAANTATYERDRRAQLEMERYSELYLEAMPYETGEREYDGVCAAIAEASRFRQAAIFLRNAGGTFRLGGRAGLDAATAAALDAMARRITDEKTRELTSAEHLKREIGHLVSMDLSPLMSPDEIPLLGNFRHARMIGIRVRDGGWQGALLLGDLRDPEEPLGTDDVLPLELLVARLGAAREHSALLRRLMQSERLAGLGQLAGGVAHELNNPLTAVTGYAELMAETGNEEVRERAEVILSEARRMKKIISSLVRFRRVTPMGRAPVSVELLLRDIDKLARHDIESARIEFDLRIPEQLPRVLADGEQIRQVFLQVVRNAITSLEEMPPGEPRRLTVVVGGVGDVVRVRFCDTGSGFPNPERAFDPFFTTRHPGEGVGLGLSLCYSIVHEHGGEIFAANLEPHGAAVTIELPAEKAGAAAQDSPLAPAM